MIEKTVAVVAAYVSLKPASCTFGELLERPALNRLREDANKGLISQVICYDPDRLLGSRLLSQCYAALWQQAEKHTHHFSFSYSLPI